MRLHRIGVIAAISIALLTISSPVRAQTRPFTLIHGLSFGKVLRGVEGGALTMDPVGSLVCTGLIAPSGVGQTSPRLQVSGETPHRYTVTSFPPALRLSGPSGATVIVDAWTSGHTVKKAGPSVLTMDTTGLLDLGATLRIPGKALPGSYYGEASLTVSDDSGNGLLVIFPVMAEIRDGEFVRSSQRVEVTTTPQGLQLEGRTTIDSRPNESVTVNIQTGIEFWNHGKSVSMSISPANPAVMLRLDASGHGAVDFSGTLAPEGTPLTRHPDGVPSVMFAFD